MRAMLAVVKSPDLMGGLAMSAVALLLSTGIGVMVFEMVRGLSASLA